MCACVCEEQRKGKENKGGASGLCSQRTADAEADRGLRKLDFELLYYSCQVGSNHVGYFNKRVQQGETGSSLVLRLPRSRPFRRPVLSSTFTLASARYFGLGSSCLISIELEETYGHSRVQIVPNYRDPFFIYNNNFLI